ncbi:cation diffusion facilitator family transporter [Halanaeroarchaeum sulfurireducens]|uniref:Cation diffusion facilitator family transporter n=1 Tax=Halanaeroarchaeum sulfurireducens TaxID=1604004 RepID=A0A0F7PC01_9EURY|nr:cation diffusion facilitator family transporter [Halanaeroarchaeum sulfurireducens]AKH97670.1 cation diffusion facilitator family transporter [Halanaeroarchaeum sulfurireducens]ALG82065.1 cation diffusion facilitator family transporter [Halanaeroarchaeum sulfurireducens]
MDEDRWTFVRTSWVNVVGNVAKIVVEGAIGLTFGSLALIADAAHSLADLLASVIVLVWGRLAFEGPDRGHPHGHERVEPLTALFVGATLVLLAFKLLWDSGTGIIEGPSVVYSPYLVGGLAFAILDMIVVYWYTERSNRSLGSPALDALGKDALNDVYTSMAAVVGVFGAAIGYPVLDAIAGGLVSTLVLREGLLIMRENVDYLVGSAPPMEKLDEIRSTIRSHPAVEGVHDLRCHYVGPTIEVEFHAEIAGDLSLTDAHRVEMELRDRVLSLPNVGDVHVHLDPLGIGEWKDASEDSTQ